MSFSFLPMIQAKTEEWDKLSVFAIHSNFLMINTKKYSIIDAGHIILIVLFGGIYDKSIIFDFYGTIVHEDGVAIDEITTIISNTEMVRINRPLAAIGGMYFKNCI